MKSLIWVLCALPIVTSCQSTVKPRPEQITDQSTANVSLGTMEMIDQFTVFDREVHLQPLFDSVAFDSLHGWDLGWAILEPINLTQSDEHEFEIAKQFSPGQKALYFFWYLDAQVTNGGFVQFFWNDYRRYVPTIIKGLVLVGDTEVERLVVEADSCYVRNVDLFTKCKAQDDWAPLYEELTQMDALDAKYYAAHDSTMALIEKYIRSNPFEFVRFE